MRAGLLSDEDEAASREASWNALELKDCVATGVERATGEMDGEILFLLPLPLPRVLLWKELSGEVAFGEKELNAMRSLKFPVEVNRSSIPPLPLVPPLLLDALLLVPGAV